MSKSRQRELFTGNSDSLPLVPEPERTCPLLGLRVWLPQACRCGAVFAVIEAGDGPHHAGLRCACRRHRGWISGETPKFLRDVVSRFGRPTEPIEIRAPTVRITAPVHDAEPATASENERETS